MRRIIFDIETVGVDFADLDGLSQEHLLKFADTPKKIEEAKLSTSFYPLTGQVVAVALLDAQTQRGMVFFQNGAGEEIRLQEEGIKFISADEKAILSNFWRIAEACDQLISFNGRLFDGPFLMLRSAIHKIRTTKNLLPYRYSAGVHVDLADQLTFYDAMRRRFPLHMWCRAFGIPSPKEGGINGLLVKQFFHEKRYLELARYCLADVRATKALYHYWEEFLRF